MSRRIALWVTLAVLAPGFAWAQGDDEGFHPSNEQLNKELDDSLRREYDGQPRPQQPPPPPVVEEPAPDEDQGDEDDGFRLRLGALAAHYYTRLQGVRVSYREGTLGGETIRLDENGHAVANFGDDWENSQTYKGWFDIGKHVSLTGSFRRTVYRTEQPTARSFQFGEMSFLQGQRVETKIDLATADFDVVVKPINNRWVSLDLHFGGRYIYWETRFRRTDTTLPDQSSTERLEAGVPMIGLGLTVRPLEQLQFFASGRIGHLEYDRRERWTYDRRGRFRHIDALKRTTTSAEVDAGVMILLADTIGIVGGYRMDYVRVEREVDQRSAGFRGYSHGVYGGAILQF